MFNVIEDVVKLTIKYVDGVIELKLINDIVEYSEDVYQKVLLNSIIPDKCADNK